MLSLCPGGVGWFALRHERAQFLWLMRFCNNRDTALAPSNVPQEKGRPRSRRRPARGFGRASWWARVMAYTVAGLQLVCFVVEPLCERLCLPQRYHTILYLKGFSNAESGLPASGVRSAVRSRFNSAAPSMRALTSSRTHKRTA